MIQMDSHYLNNTQHVRDVAMSYATEQQRAVTRLCIQCGLFLCNMVRKARWLMSFPHDWVGHWEWTASKVLSLRTP